MKKYVVIGFDGVRGWTKLGVNESLPEGFSERDEGSGVFDSDEDGREHLLYVEITGEEEPCEESDEESDEEWDKDEDAA